MSGILYGEIAEKSTFSWRHLTNAYFTSEGCTDHIFINWAGLSSSWTTSKFLFGIGLTSSSRTSISNILTLLGPSSATIEEVRRPLRMTYLIHHASLRLELITIGFPSLLWYATFRWNGEATTSSLSRKDLPRIPLKTLLHVTTKKLMVTFLSSTPSPNDSFRFAILQGWVVELLKAKIFLPLYWLRSDS